MEFLLIFQFLHSSDGGLDCDTKGTLGVQVPPATVLMREPLSQVPAARVFILVLPWKEQVSLMRWLISMFFAIFLREKP